MTFYFIGISYFCFDNIFCIMTVHLAGQFQILRYRFAKLCNVEDQISEKDTGSTLFVQAQRFYERFKAYVRYHQTLIDYCEKIENVYTMIILGQVLVFSVLICLFGYQILLVSISRVVVKFKSKKKKIKILKKFSLINKYVLYILYRRKEIIPWKLLILYYSLHFTQNKIFA